MVKKKDLLIIFFASIVMILPLFLSDYVIKDDSMFHITNITAMLSTMHNLKVGNILPLLAGNFGYGTPIFYPPLPHLFVTYLCYFTSLNVINGIRVTYYIILLLSGLVMYFLALKVLKNDKKALLASVLYMGFPYHLSEIYVRDALGETFLFIFLPLILLGLTYLFTDKNKFYLFFVLGYVGGMLSHLTMMVYFTILLIPFFIIYRKKIFNKDIIMTFIKSACFILLIVSPTIVHMFQNKLLGNYRVFYPGVMAQNIQHSGLYLHYINYLGIFNYLGLVDNKIWSIHYFFDIVSIYLLIKVYKNRDNLKLKTKYPFLITFGLLAFWMSSIVFPWDLLPESFRLIQFPWRIMTFVALIVALLAPLGLDKSKINYSLMIGLIIGFSLFSTQNSYINKVDLNNLDYEIGMGWQQEYLPVNVYNNLDYFDKRSNDIISTGSVTVTNDDFPNLTFTINEDSLVELPRIYYPGYTLTNENNEEVNIYENDKGFIAANLEIGNYTLQYTGTKYDKIASYISIISIITFIIYLITIKKRN